MSSLLSLLFPLLASLTAASHGFGEKPRWVHAGFDRDDPHGSFHVLGLARGDDRTLVIGDPYGTDGILVFLLPDSTNVLSLVGAYPSIRPSTPLEHAGGLTLVDGLSIHHWDLDGLHTDLTPGSSFTSLSGPAASGDELYVFLNTLLPNSRWERKLHRLLGVQGFWNELATYPDDGSMPQLSAGHGAIIPGQVLWPNYSRVVAYPWQVYDLPPGFGFSDHRLTATSLQAHALIESGDNLAFLELPSGNLYDDFSFPSATHYAYSPHAMGGRLLFALNASDPRFQDYFMEFDLGPLVWRRYPLDPQIITPHAISVITARGGLPLIATERIIDGRISRVEAIPWPGHKR